MTDNRAVANVKNGLEKGENLFIYYGGFVHDWFLYDMYRGIMTLNDSYKTFFLEEQKYDFYTYIRTNTFEMHKYVNGSISKTNEIIEGRIDSDDPIANLELGNSENKESVKNVSNQAEQSGNEQYASLMKAVDFAKNNPNIKMAFFFEDLEWTAGFYKSSNDSELGIIEKIQELVKNSNCTVIISIANADMLSKYNFDINGKNVEMLGSPAVNEIWNTYIRRYSRKYDCKDIVSNKKLLDLFYISEAIGSGDKSLKEAIRIFDKVMSDSKGKINKTDFESAIEKHIDEKISLDDVVMGKNVKESIVDQIDQFLQTDDVSRVTKGMILTGPPGTGKTFIVKALANEKNCYFMSPSLADLKGEFVGQTSGKVKRIFQQARANAPTIMFIDEADTVFPLRDIGAGDSDSFSKDMVNQFLVEMDGLTTGNSKVFVIAATNRVNVLDNAIKSRLGTPIAVQLPDKLQRKQLFEKNLKNEMAEKFCKYPFFDEILDKTNRMSGRDIKNFVSQLKSEACGNSRELKSYDNEDEVRELFLKALKNYENDLIRDLQSKLHVTIKRPEKGKNYSSIIGCENVKSTITKQLRMFDPAERLRAQKYEIAVKRGILLYGPPGNGKSQMAEAAASHHNLIFMKITSDTFTKTTLSEQSQTLLRIFDGAIQLSELCSEQAGVLLFFDEFDSLVSNDILDSRIRGTMLTQLDDKDTMRAETTKVLFVAATNFMERLDEAVIRDGRIDDKIEMNNPTEDEATQMIIQFCQPNAIIFIPEGAETHSYVKENVYRKFKDAYEKTELEREFSLYKKSWIANGGTAKSLRDYLSDPEVCGEKRPSGAMLRSFVNKLVEKAYDNNYIDNNDKIVINEEVVLQVCGKSEGTEE